MNIIYLLNATFVGIFGIVLSAAFCDILWTRQKVSILAGSMAVMLLFQGILCYLTDPSTVQNLYPVITHIPLILVLCILSKKYLWSAISVLTAYLCCQIRRWLALFITTLLSGDLMVQSIMELILTLPLLLLLIRYAAPSMRSMSHCTASMQRQFGVIPLMYYGFDYLTQVYTDLLTQGSLTVLEFMPFVCCLFYLKYILHTSAAERVRSQLEQTQASLNLQVAQAVREIESLRESQKKTSTYRHDLHHHMQYLSACIQEGKYDQAQVYIQEICAGIETSKVTLFCENESTNLILSSFVRKAGNYGIPLNIKAAIPQIISISESDLCVLLSNALENALHACQRLKEKGAHGMIDLLAYEKSGKLFVQIINSCIGDVVFSRGIPVTDAPGHGIGVRSICAIVEKYGGLCTFSVKDDQFILRISL